MSTTYSGGHKGTNNVPFGHFVSPMNTVGEAVYTAFSEASAVAGKVAKAIHAKLRARASIKALSDLDDHQLADIGIHRSDIAYLARRVAENPGFDHRSAF